MQRSTGVNIFFQMENEQDRKPRVFLGEHGVPNAFEVSNLLHLQGDWTIDKFKESFQIKIIKESKDEFELEFDLIGCSTALANAFRRILLSEVPSMAIDKVYMFNNTSIIQDEVLAHRLGLLPLRADPRLFDYPPKTSVEREDVSDLDTLRYELKVTCRKNPQAPKDSRRQEDMYVYNNVYTKDIKWKPIGKQKELYPEGEKQFGIIGANGNIPSSSENLSRGQEKFDIFRDGRVTDDILICKMKPNQEINCWMDAIKGIGKDHAKFSPVATATYRLLPVITITKPIRGSKEMVKKFQNCFSPGVIEVNYSKKSDTFEAKVKDARNDSCSRNVYRHDEFKNCVKLERVPDHFIFTVESVGALPSSILFVEAVKVLKEKCKIFIEELDTID